MGTYEVTKYSIELESELIIPCHMDNTSFPVTVDEVKKQFDEHSLNYKILDY